MSAVTSDEQFAIIPESVLFANISPQAVRLYCVLRRYADQWGTCYPSRKTLATDMHVTSEKTIDRAVKELVAIGALEVIHHKTASGEHTSNIYVVSSSARVRVGRPSRKRSASPSEGWGQTSPHLGSQMSTEREPLNDTQDCNFVGPPTGRDLHEHLDGIAAEIDADLEATGYIAGTVGLDGSELVAEAISQLRSNDRVTSPEAWLVGALQHLSPVGKANRLAQIAGVLDD